MKLPHGDFPGVAAGRRLEQIDAARQLDDGVVLEVVGAPHHLARHIIYNGLSHTLAAPDKDAAVDSDSLQGFLGQIGRAHV